MRQVYFESVAAEVLGQYFENYKGGKINDLSSRALVYRRIREFLTTFDTSNTYVINGEKYVKIENVCIIEYVMQDNEIFVTNILLSEKNLL